MNHIAQLSSSITFHPNPGVIEAHCREALRLVDYGEYDRAALELGQLWKGLGHRPNVKHCTEQEKAWVLLSTGVLTSWFGNLKQLTGAQELAKDLLSESQSLFHGLGDDNNAAWAQRALAYCYWRVGSYDEARIVALEALHQLKERLQPEMQLRLYLCLVVVETTVQNYRQSEYWLAQAEPLVEDISHPILQGSFYFESARVQKSLSTDPHDKYLQLATDNYTTAAHYFALAGQRSFLASIYNNLGNLYGLKRSFPEAQRHIELSLELYRELGDKLHLGMVWESKAQLLLEAGNLSEAEQAALASIHTLKDGDSFAILADSLITLGKIKARQGQYFRAEQAFLKAYTLALNTGAESAAGLALLSLLEELGPQLTAAVFLEKYQHTTRLLGESPLVAIQKRLRRLAENALLLEPVPEIIIQTQATQTATFTPGFSLKETVHQLEVMYINLALEQSGNKIINAAALLGMQHQTLSLMLRNRHKDILAKLQQRKKRSPSAPKSAPTGKRQPSVKA
jgi:tetratricopeptide (TPR) repeat protein